MWLSMVIFWSLFVVFAYLAIRAYRTRRPGGPRATAILDERLARGEISTEEYRTRRETLAAPRAQGEPR